MGLIKLKIKYFFDGFILTKKIFFDIISSTLYIVEDCNLEDLEPDR